MPGGAGNVFNNLIALSNKQHVLFGAVGKDEHLISLKALFGSNLKYYLYTDSTRKTTLKLRFIAQNQQLLRCDIETPIPMSYKLQQKILNEYKKRLKSVDIVILSDYNKGFFSRGFIQKIICLAKKSGKIVFVDPKCSDYSVYAGADFLKPNRQELQEVSGREIHTIKDTVSAARFLCRKYFINNIIVTLGAEGMLYVSRNNSKPIHHKIEHVSEIVDVSGAGDTALAVLALAIASKVPMPLSLKIANVAAKIAISKSGTATVSQEEIIHCVNKLTPEIPDETLLNKIVTLQQAKKLVRKWKKDGQTICFTNGCFDCLHYGYISSFMQTKKHGDRLIVALNSDRSVKKNKGDSRPIQNEQTRAARLASFQSVDLVIVFNEKNALKLVRELQPDIIAKEGYPLEKWTEARFVQGYGGKVVFLKKEKGYSTSKLIGKLSNVK